MVPMCVKTLVVTNPPHPSVLVLCPVEDYGEKRSCRVVPIWIGPAEARQLGAALEEARFNRPMTHDLFLDAITNLDASVDHAEIVDQKGITFFAKLYLSQGSRMIALDARPSDAVSLAIREGANVLMSEDVLGRASFPYIVKNEEDDEAEIEEFHSFIGGLTPDDFVQ